MEQVSDLVHILNLPLRRGGAPMYIGEGVPGFTAESGHK